MKIRLLSEKDIRSVSPTLPEIVDLVEEVYRLDAAGKVEVPSKIAVHPDRPNSFLHAMPAWVAGRDRALGMKWVSSFPGNFDRGLPESMGVVILNDPDIGLPCCFMEGMYVTFVRTAACAAVAVKHLAPRPPETLGLIGCGGLGLWSLRVMTATFPSIKRVFVSSRTPASREKFCAEMSQEGSWTITPVDDPLNAVRNMDIVVSSLPAADIKPVISGDALTPGTLFIPLDLVYSWQNSVLPVIDRFVADSPAYFSAYVKAKRESAIPLLKPSFSLQDVVAGKTSQFLPSDRILIGVCGIASTDVMIGWEIYRRALAADVGLEFDMFG